MQSDPVIIPVEVDLSRATTALRGLGDTIQTVRGAAAGGGAVPGMAAAAGAAGMGTDTLALNTLRSLQRELNALESSVTRLVFGIDKLIAFQQQGVGVAAPAVAPAEREAPEPKGPEPAGGGEGAARPARGERGNEALQASLREASGTIRQAVLGALSLGGIGVGLGAMYQQVTGWFQVHERLAPEFGRLALESATPDFPGGRFYRGLEHRLTRRPRPGTMDQFLSISDYQAGMETLGGVMGDPGLAARFLRPVGAIGLQAFGQPGPAFNVAAGAYETFRSEKVPELLGTLVRLADQAGVSRAQMIQQFGGLRGFFEARQGQYARTDAELGRIAGYQGMLNRLPGGVGVGQGGVTLAQGLAAFGAPGSGGMAEALRMRAYTKATGKPAIGTPEQYADFIAWSQDPNNDPAVAQEARRHMTRGQFELEYSGYGQRPIAPYGAVYRGDLRVRPVLDTAGEIARRQRESAEGLAETMGGEELVHRQEYERLIFTGWLMRAAFRQRQHAQRWLVHHQKQMLAINAGLVGGGLLERIIKSGGPGLGMGLGGWWLGRRGARGLRGGRPGAAGEPPPEGAAGEGAAGEAAAGEAAAGAEAGEAAAGMGEAAEVLGAAGLAGFLPELAILAGVAAAGYEIFGRGGRDIMNLPIMQGGGLMFAPGDDPNALLQHLRDTGPALQGTRHVGPWASGYIMPGQVPSFPLPLGFTPGLPGAPGGQLTLGRGGRVDLRSQFFRDVERQYGIPAGVLSAIAKQESGGRPGAVGPGGRARGLFQFMPGTAAKYGIDPFDPVASTIATAKMLRENYQRLGSWERAIGAHYGGPGTPFDQPIHGMTPHQYAEQVLRRGGAYFGSMPGLGGAGQPGTEPTMGDSSGWLSNVGMALASGGQVDIYIHMDPSFPGSVTSDSSPGVKVTRQQ